MSERETMVGWRLVLGSDAEQGLGCGLNGVEGRRDRALGYLYNREYGGGRNVRGGQGGERNRDRQGGMEESQLTVPEWINEVHALFPKRTIERIERDALERYHVQEL